jgi:hypothetical protein
MKLANLYSLLAVALAVSATSARADTVVGTGGWQSYTAADLNQDGTPFWDNKSLDGANKNIGYQLLPATPNYYGNSDGSGVSNESFTRGASAGAISGALSLRLSAWKAQSTLGWYDVSDPTVLHTIWDGTDTPTSGASQSFTPSTNWGLWFSTPGGTFYSNSALDSPADNSQHFAIFELSLASGAESYEIGAEDKPYVPGQYENRGDFQDCVFTIQSQPGNNPFNVSVPEPASLSVLGLGAAGLLLRRRKAK